MSTHKTKGDAAPHAVAVQDKSGEWHRVQYYDIESASFTTEDFVSIPLHEVMAMMEEVESVWEVD